MSNKRWLWLLAVCALIFILAIIWKLLSTGTIIQKQKHALPVRYTKATEVKLDKTVESIGTTKAFETVTITANVTEYVRKLHFEDGDAVKKGDLLVELSTDEEQAQLAEAEARLNEAQNQFKRVKSLMKRKFSAQSEYDTQQASVASIKAQIQRINTMIADRTIHAPFDGILGFRLISDGTLVEPGDKIVVLDMIQPLRLDFSIPERYLKKIHKDMPFTATSIAFEKHTFKGKIETISPRVNEQTRSLLLRGRLENKRKLLKPGMLMNINIKLFTLQALKIPEEAVLASGKKRYVYVIKEDNSVEKQTITILQRVGANVYVKATFPSQTKIVTEGGFKLRPGQKVSIINAPK